METLQEAKQYLRENWKEGVDCPCCTQFVKFYKRKINSGMTRNLISMYNTLPRGEFFHVQNMFTEKKEHNGRNWTLFKYWSIVEENLNDSKIGAKTSGEWRITEKGILFVENKLQVPKFIKLYNNQSYGFEGEQVGIKECLGEKFSYDELMNQ